MGITIINKQFGRHWPTPEEIRDELLALPDSERAFIYTDPSGGEHKIISLRRNKEGLVEYDYEAVPE